jgi:hypothetical protein
MKVSGHIHCPVKLPQGKEPPVPTEYELGGAQAFSGRFTEENEIFITSVKRTTARRTAICSLVIRDILEVNTF